MQLGVVGRTLIEVAGVQEEHLALAFGLAHRIHESGPFDYASPAVTQRVHMGMGIVGVQYDELGPAGTQGGSSRENTKYAFHHFITTLPSV